MNELQVRAILAGLFFGIWPLIMNRSRLNGNVSSAVFAFGAFLMVAPFALRSIDKSLVISADWKMAAFAAICGGLGLLAFNGMLAKATSEKVSALFVLMIVVQIAIPAVYQVVITRSITPMKLLGFVAAAVSAFLFIG